MKKKYQNGFFIFGIVVLVVMLTQLDYPAVWANLQRAGYWFFAILGMWIFLYMINTLSWYLIIRSGHKGKSEIGFWWLYKLSITGFALNYATPGGLMGGVPYRIMALSTKVGTERASSSVILYTMTHIFSHFWFWFFSILLYVFTMPMNLFMGILLSVIMAFCLLGLWFFSVGYRDGMAMKVINLLRHFPVIKRWAQKFLEKHDEQLKTIDSQIAALHKQNRSTFFSAVALELLSRTASSLEVYFALLVMTGDVSFPQCILITAFTTLFANMLFFIPLQIGGLEGGYMMSTAGMSMPVNFGIFISLLVRLRELIWTAIGLLLIKLDKTQKRS